MGRPATTAPKPHHPYDDKVSYPSHMLPSAPVPRRLERSSTLAPFSTYESPYASHHQFYGTPVHSPPPPSLSPTSVGSSAPSQPQSPARKIHNVPHVNGHSHNRHHSLNVNPYATDYAGTNSKLVPSRLPSKRHTQQYPSSNSGLGAVGPALSQNIPPVLPRPPSLKGSSSSQNGLALGRSGSLGRSGTVKKGEFKTITDEEQAAYAALNTYR